MYIHVFLQTAVGGVDPRDALLCVRLAAARRGAHGGLYRRLGSAAARLDSGPPAGAARLTPAPERGETCIGSIALISVNLPV